METPRKWQTGIEVRETGEASDDLRLATFYGASIAELQAAVETHLRESRLLSFSNGGDHVAGRHTYFYSDGKNETMLPRREAKVLEEGWWVLVEKMRDGAIDQYAPSKLERILQHETAAHAFVECALIPVKGPDYRSGAVAGRELLVPDVEVVLRETDEHRVNDLLARGWMILGLEYQGLTDGGDHLVKRVAVFVLGHAELDAAGYTLCHDPYQYTRASKMLHLHPC